MIKLPQAVIEGTGVAGLLSGFVAVRANGASACANRGAWLKAIAEAEKR